MVGKTHRVYPRHAATERCAAVILASFVAVFSSIAAGQTYPQRAVQVIVATSPGGGVDMIARTIGQKLTPILGHTFVVDNRPGAGGAIGVALVAKAAPDGHILLLASSSHVAINPALS